MLPVPSLMIKDLGTARTLRDESAIHLNENSFIDLGQVYPAFFSGFRSTFSFIVETDITR